ncbi:MAG: tRNA (adenosine(37)-N6)-threonylcarbamoyltransferase complex ATPase subunit type 1 TsaE [Bacteroidales bacterium]|nr:tRNA (adenosine(37)-N6)-threonylcarbamoyltransferase complex ATPase subunit type 1 TsaE [Bacteroidales bacterium]
METLFIKSLHDLPAVAKQFNELARGYRRFAFYGKMGSGKTTFITEICRQLGAEDILNSPSFALINEYSTNTGEIIYHFDLYRIKSIEELFDIGYEDYFYGDAILFIEWPELAEELLPEDTCKVIIEETDNKVRKVKMYTK